jgi:hypothetical protein
MMERRLGRPIACHRDLADIADITCFGRVLLKSQPQRENNKYCGLRKLHMLPAAGFRLRPSPAEPVDRWTEGPGQEGGIRSGQMCKPQ